MTEEAQRPPDVTTHLAMEHAHARLFSCEFQMCQANLKVHVVLRATALYPVSHQPE